MLKAYGINSAFTPHFSKVSVYELLKTLCNKVSYAGDICVVVAR